MRAASVALLWAFLLTVLLDTKTTTASIEIQPLELGISVLEDPAVDALGEFFGFSVKEISMLIDITKLGLGLVGAISKVFGENFDISSFTQFNQPGGDKKLLSMYQLISRRLIEIQTEIGDTQANIRDLTQSLPQMVRWEVALDTLSEYSTPINTLYHKFTYYQMHKEEVEESTLIDFAKSVVSHDIHSVMSLMGHIHNMVAPDDPPIVKNFKSLANQEYEVLNNEITTKMSIKLKQEARKRNSRLTEKDSKTSLGNLYFRPSLFKMLEDSLNEYSVCSMNQSPQSMIFGFYALLSLTQAGGYAMTNFAWSILRFYNEGNFTVEEQLSDQLYTHYSKALQLETLQALSRASNSFRKCEPKVHKEGETYEAVTELLQGYIENEVDLNSRGTCMNTCSGYEHVEVAGCYQGNTQYCGKHRRCKGTVHNCKFMDADAWVCLSKKHGRRYDWIRYENLQVLGKEHQCANNVIKVDSWWRWFVHCSYCMCLCDDPNSSDSDRFISLRPSVSDVKSNKVVTGVRFVKKDRIIHAQVEQGEVLPQGLISKKTVGWAPLHDIRVNSSEFVSGSDYATLRYELRNIDLDLLKAPRDHVVSGLRFRILGSHINLEMWVTPFNFTDGSLKPELSYWVSNDATPLTKPHPRHEIHLVNPDNPTKAVSTQMIDSHNGTFVQMQPTSMISDVSQLTVPFFDAQPVVTSPPAPLLGVHLYHKGQPGYGGFLALETFSFNLTEQFKGVK